MAYRYNLLNGLILIVIIIICTSKFGKSKTQLNDSVLTPLHYNVKIQFDIYGNLLLGECNITFLINRPTNTIIMNLGTKNKILIEIVLIHDDHIVDIPQLLFTNQPFNKNYIHIFTQPDSYLSPGIYILEIRYTFKHYIRILFKSFHIAKEKDKM